MKIAEDKLIEDLKSRTQQCIDQASELANLPLAVVQWREDPNHWNILECVEHLNMYGDFYLPAIKQALIRAKSKRAKNEFRTQLWGDFFVLSLAPPKDRKLKKMNAFKHLNPFKKSLNASAISKFIEQQNHLLSMLEEAEQLDLSSVKTKTTIRFVKLRLGDTLRAEIYHNQRHLDQAYRVLDNYCKRAGNKATRSVQLTA